MYFKEHCKTKFVATGPFAACILGQFVMAKVHKPGERPRKATAAEEAKAAAAKKPQRRQDRKDRNRRR
jgi:hypothetical protein